LVEDIDNLTCGAGCQAITRRKVWLDAVEWRILRRRISKGQPKNVCDRLGRILQEH
jgi:hypothetical protein